MAKFLVLKNALAKLSKRERGILYGAVLFVSFVILDNTIVKPIAEKLHTLSQEIISREAGIKKSIRILAQKNRIEAETEKYRDFLSSSLSVEEGMTLLLKEIEGLANSASVYLVDVKPSTIQDEGLSRRFKVTVNFEAQMEQTSSFMHSLEVSEKFLTVESYQLSPKSKDSSIAKCNMLISKLIIIENEDAQSDSN